MQENETISWGLFHKTVDFAIYSHKLWNLANLVDNLPTAKIGCKLQIFNLQRIFFGQPHSGPVLNGMISATLEPIQRTLVIPLFVNKLGHFYGKI